MTEELLILFVLLTLSGFFSSAETAFFSLSISQVRYLAKQGNASFRLVQKMKEDPHRLLTTILIGNNVVNVSAASLATSITMQLFPNYAISLATGVMTFFILVFGEVLPKSLATRNNVLIARFSVYPLYWLSIAMYPLLFFLNFIPSITGRIKKASAPTEDELKSFVEVVEETGEIKEEEREFIHNIFDFDDTNAFEIMTPRTDMFVIDADEPLDLEAIARSGFTRIPVIEGDIDHVIGILNIKDLFLYQATTDGEIDVKKIMREPYFVPEHKKLDRLLHQFKSRKTHMAIVVDEHGGVSGLITLEDALEEIVGEIEDETDKDEPLIVAIGENEWIVLGKTEIADVQEEIGMEIPDSNTYETFSGYILEILGRIPAENEEIRIDGYIVVVRRKEGVRIKEYLVKKLDKPDDNDSASEGGTSGVPPL